MKISNPDDIYFIVCKEVTYKSLASILKNCKKYANDLGEKGFTITPTNQ
ncbi:hypothetical protein AAE02nite_47850 [Adhaeribacter aerolatus]|uniref:Uncharacterized protein n=1 Tax=Adhaeribacter aerolatus TaxID=670289 RepID=A0A512B5A9_9BACT|nr:hypothetical protein AAE02nite_47850 [Adhaeribacter aerolatus]